MSEDPIQADTTSPEPAGDAPTAVLEDPAELSSVTLASPFEPEPAPRPLREPAKPDAGGFVRGTGRRKASVARVRIRPAKNGPVYKISSTKARDLSIDEFFSEPQHRAECRKPLVVSSTEESLEVYIKVTGGGISGQSGAILLGLSRALIAYDPTLEQALRDEGFLSRDAREVERKKYGQRGARRRFQFSKR
ncbi:MAG: 30S ribosomal protein S9 [Planctomycetota bacterium]